MSKEIVKKWGDEPHPSYVEPRTHLMIDFSLEKGKGLGVIDIDNLFAEGVRIVSLSSQQLEPIFLGGLVHGSIARMPGSSRETQQAPILGTAIHRIYSICSRTCSLWLRSIHQRGIEGD